MLMSCMSTPPAARGGSACTASPSGSLAVANSVASAAHAPSGRRWIASSLVESSAYPRASGSRLDFEGRAVGINDLEVAARLRLPYCVHTTIGRNSGVLAIDMGAR